VNLDFYALAQQKRSSQRRGCILNFDPSPSPQAAHAEGSGKYIEVGAR
jgi:hypothetical protein